MKAHRIILEAVILLGVAASVAFGTADVLVLQIPAAFVADGVTVHGVRCSIENGYPNNTYGVKGTFSPGDLPYYGVNYNPETMQWVGQKDAWIGAQRHVTTDANGAWSGWIWMRLESSIPNGEVRFRLSVIPLDPISNPGPTVSDWYTTRTFNMSVGGDGGWIAGHAYTDTAHAIPHNGVVIVALGVDDSVLAAGLCQNSAIHDGGDHSDHGYFRLPVPVGVVAHLQARTATDNFYVSAYYQKSAPWTVLSGRQTLVDVGLWGDIDGDGYLRRADATAGLRIASGLGACDTPTVARGDVSPDSGDGVITMADVVVLTRRLAGW